MAGFYRGLLTGRLPCCGHAVRTCVRPHRRALVNSITDAETVGSPRAQAAYDRLAQTAICG